MNFDSILLTVFGFITTGLLGVIWWVMQQYYQEDKKWKGSSDNRLRRIAQKIDELDLEVKSFKTITTQKLEVTATKNLSQYKLVKEEIALQADKHQHAIEMLQMELERSGVKANHGKIVLLEKKLGVIYNALIKVKGSQ